MLDASCATLALDGLDTTPGRIAASTLVVSHDEDSLPRVR